jgi:hypothetical protein
MVVQESSYVLAGFVSDKRGNRDPVVLSDAAVMVPACVCSGSQALTLAG